jgi:hypothetical protein
MGFGSRRNERKHGKLLQKITEKKPRGKAAAELNSAAARDAAVPL